MRPHRPSIDRRAFLARSSAVLGASVLARGALAAPRGSSDDVLRLALVGCGGRGTGAAAQALSTAGPVRLVAMADAFQDRLDASLSELEKIFPAESGRLDVPPERRFVGFDAFARAIEADVDVVVLATPPGFRPQHLAHVVAHGRHAFVEKPVAVDAPGVRQVLAAGLLAREKGLKLGIGLQRHHERRYLETVRRLKEGAIGELLFYRCYWNGAGVWVNPRQPGQSEMEYQMRNWYYFNWLCGDHIVEQHIHNLDVCNWIEGATPALAQGQGGREVRRGPDHGEIFDHHAVEYTYPSGRKLFSQCRHIEGCWNSVSEHAHGTHGSADVSAGLIRWNDGGIWQFEDEDPNPYQTEHDALFRAIREDLPHDEVENGAHATMTAILGRMATYGGQEVGWEAALASELSLAPSAYAWDAAPPTLPDAAGSYPVARPGATRVL